MKTKKVSIKPFLNQSLKPDSDLKVLNPSYPLYYLISYDRKNTHIKSATEKYFESLSDIDARRIVESESMIFVKLVHYLIDKEDFNLKGLKPKFLLHSTKIAALMNKTLKTELGAVILKINSDYKQVLKFEDEKSEFETLYKLCSSLFEDLPKHIPAELNRKIETYRLFLKVGLDPKGEDSPTIIDWKDIMNWKGNSALIEGSFKELFKKKLDIETKSKKASAIVINTIDEMIDTYLEKNG
jgi:hypothetical protein